MLKKTALLMGEIWLPLGKSDQFNLSGVSLGTLKSHVRFSKYLHITIIIFTQMEGLLKNGPGYSSLLGKISDFR